MAAAIIALLYRARGNGSVLTSVVLVGCPGALAALWLQRRSHFDAGAVSSGPLVTDGIGAMAQGSGALVGVATSKAGFFELLAGRPWIWLIMS